MQGTSSIFNFKFLLLFICNVVTVYCDDIVKLDIKQGELLGKLEKTFHKQTTYYAFKSIPFAEPPLRELRFLPPKPHAGWTGAYEAFERKPTCYQFNTRMRNGEPFGISGSEDCLYLSVFTPNLEESLPVVVFEYNDNFRTGFNDTETYSPDFFIEEDIIVVYIKHRLGVFGYLTTEDEIIPPNAGIKDFVMGLEWVRDNIKTFGGDPSRVTIMGSRSGGALVHILMYSEKAKDLFNAVIMQSGSAMEPIYFDENVRDKSFELGKLLDVDTKDSATLLGELQNIDPEKLLTEEFNVLDSEGLKKNQMKIFPFSPTVERIQEGAILTSLPENAKPVMDVPVLIGLNSREGLDLASHFIFNPKIIDEIGSDFSMHFPIRPGFRFDRDSSIYKEAMKEIDNFYYEDGYLHTSNILELTVNTGDAVLSYALDYSAKKLAKELESPVYYYMFDFRGALNENSEHMSRNAFFSLQMWGATITDELCYLHLCGRIQKKYEELNKLVSEQTEMKVLKKMVHMWTNFIKMRNPTPPGDEYIKTTWMPIDKSSEEANYLHITKTFKMKSEPLGDRAKFWNTFLDKYSKMAVNKVVRDDVKGEHERDEL